MNQSREILPKRKLKEGGTAIEKIISCIEFIFNIHDYQAPNKVIDIVYIHK